MATPKHGRAITRAEAESGFFKPNDVVVIGNTIYLKQGVKDHGRALTPAEAASGKYSKDQVVVIGGGIYLKAGPSASSAPKTVTNPNAPGPYKGNGNKPGQLPKRDAAGKYSWIDANGHEQHQEGYDAATGSWNYLGPHSQFEWTAAETFNKNAPPPPADFKEMTDQQKLQFLNEAHQQMSQQFMNDVATGQTAMINDLGQAVSTFADELKANNIGLSNDIRNTQAALEASGMTFSGAGKQALGEGFSATGHVSPEQLALLQSNLQQINALPGTAVTTGTTPAQIPQPQPIEITNGTAVTPEQKNKAWEDFYKTDTWKNYVAQVNAMSTLGNATGVSGTGRYGFSGNLDTYGETGLNTAAAQGSVFYNRTQLAESARKNFNQNARSLGTQYERLLGSNNISNVGIPSIGGQAAFTTAPNVLGSLQSGYQTNTASQANQNYSDFLNQYAYTFPTSL